MSKIQFEGLFLDVCEVRVGDKVIRSNLSYEDAKEMAVKENGEVWQYFTTPLGTGYICVGDYNLYKYTDMIKWEKDRRKYIRNTKRFIRKE